MLVGYEESHKRWLWGLPTSGSINTKLEIIGGRFLSTRQWTSSWYSESLVWQHSQNKRGSCHDDVRTRRRTGLKWAQKRECPGDSYGLVGALKLCPSSLPENPSPTIIDGVLGPRMTKWVLVSTLLRERRYICTCLGSFSVHAGTAVPAASGPWGPFPENNASSAAQRCHLLACVCACACLFANLCVAETLEGPSAGSVRDVGKRR